MSDPLDLEAERAYFAEQESLLTHAHGAAIIAEVERLREACLATHAYFKALSLTWHANEGRVPMESDAAVVEGTEKIEELCETAGRKVWGVLGLDPDAERAAREEP